LASLVSLLGKPRVAAAEILIAIGAFQGLDGTKGFWFVPDAQTLGVFRRTRSLSDRLFCGNLFEFRVEQPSSFAEEHH
jgi:hypothetical protein